MRIAVITNAFPPEARGGAGVVASDLAGLWRVSGHEVRVWTGYAGWLRRGPFLRLFGHLVLDARAARILREVLVWRPDVVVTHNLTGLGWGTGEACRRAGIRWVHVLHDVQLFEPSGQLRTDRPTLWQRFWAWYRRRVFGRPDRLVSPTAWLLDAHRRRGFDVAAGTVLPNPAPEPVVPPASVPGTVGPWLFVGRLSEDKGADLLLGLARRRPDDRFTCVGEGPLRSALESLPNVDCLGARPREEVQDRLATARALLMPSRLQENQPTVLLEAFAQGTPVIASALGGIPETVEDGGIVLAPAVDAWDRACGRMEAELPLWRAGARRRGLEFRAETARARWESLFADLR